MFKPVVYKEKDEKKKLRIKERGEKMKNTNVVEIRKMVRVDDESFNSNEKFVKKEKNNEKNEEFKMRLLTKIKSISEFCIKNFEKAEEELKKFEKFKRENKELFSRCSGQLQNELE